MYDFAGSAFCYGRDYSTVAFGTMPNNRFGLDDPEQSPFDDELYESSRTARLARGTDYWDSWYSGPGRSRGKGATLRSWRNQRALGGVIKRKAIARKMDKRSPNKPLVNVPFHGPSKFYLMG